MLVEWTPARVGMAIQQKPTNDSLWKNGGEKERINLFSNKSTNPVALSALTNEEYANHRITNAKMRTTRSSKKKKLRYLAHKHNILQTMGCAGMSWGSPVAFKEDKNLL